MVIKGGLADLHTHTTASDGLHSPTDIVQFAKAAGLSAVAITDHDTIAGVAEAIVAGERIGVRVVPGVEVSTVAGGQDIHILGYFTDGSDKQWLARLASLRDVRNHRNDMIVSRLNELGVSITMDDVREAARSKQAASDSSEKAFSIGRPHIAEVLIRQGVVSTMSEAFDKYLASGAAAYVNPPRLTPFEAVDWIHEAGGTSVIAHPGLYGDDELVEAIAKHGANGIEVFHSDHGAEEESRYAELAAKYGLIVTGGSDFHGSRQGEVFHGAVGSRTVDAVTIELLRPKKK
ncbi:PHP domain-containing protein [Paenibacillus harenae]|uniref:PHP domain-containing protein n=1 Tax=Paenibacillus harenae TaxID=306543 RepID=UPI00278F7CDE|nr:PHP domain-containing protein [Paenibacillus harenae]MDQ0059564.1 putative metal-dependent phosphoesterase TrpH [Paenibacillus harenae]